jgi:cell division protease FtsH
MSDEMGPLTFGKRDEQVFLGREISKSQDYSQDTAVRIDSEVKRFVLGNYDRARTVLTENKAILIKIADELLAREVLDADQVRKIVRGEPLTDLPTPPASGTPRDEATDRPPLVTPLPKPATQA